MPREGAVDIYRDWACHGGILSNLSTDEWWTRQITGIQRASAPGAGNPGRALAGNADLPLSRGAHKVIDGFFTDRAVDLGRFTTGPFWSCP